MKVDGRCHCGEIEIEAEIFPDRTSICHCTDCQTLSGTAFRVSAAAAEETFRIVRGVPREYVKVAASGRRRVQAFCGTCGTALYARAADMPGPVNIRAGILRQRDSLVPVRQIWRRSALPWIPAMAQFTCWEEEAQG